MKNKRNLLLIVATVMLCCVLACGSSTSSPEEEIPINEKITVEAKPTATEVVAQEPTEAPADTPMPEPTEAPEVCTRCGTTDTLVPEPTATVEPTATPEIVLVVNCPMCVEESIDLSLHGSLDRTGKSPGTVNHLDECVYLAEDTHEGILNYQVNCDNKIGWRNANLFVRPDQISQPDFADFPVVVVTLHCPDCDGSEIPFDAFDGPDLTFEHLTECFLYEVLEESYRVNCQGNDGWVSKEYVKLP